MLHCFSQSQSGCLGLFTNPLPSLSSPIEVYTHAGGVCAQLSDYDKFQPFATRHANRRNGTRHTPAGQQLINALQGGPPSSAKSRPTSHSSAAAINNTDDDEPGMTPALKLWNLHLHTAADRNEVEIVRVNPALRVFGPTWT